MRKSLLKVCGWLVCLSLALIFVAGNKFAASSFSASAKVEKEKSDDGKVVAALKFDPKVHGFSFRNYGNKQRDWQTDLTAEDLARIFGADNVCESGETPRDCVPHTTAEEWLEEKLKDMDGGHCEGFAVTSLRLFLGRKFKGKTAPSDFQDGAKTVFDLERDKQLENYIAFYHILQTLPEVYEFRAKTFDLKPSEVLQTLIESFGEERKEIYTLSIAKRIEGQYMYGHTITPFAVVDMGDDIYHVLVYDNNYPGQTKFVEFNTKEETWRYHTASNPNETARDYVGDTTTRTLSLKRMSDRERSRYTCPFGEDEETAYAGAADGASEAHGAQQVEFFLTGEGAMLIKDGDGKRIGYDAQAKKFVQEIPGAIIVPGEGGLDKEESPDYFLPLRKAAKPYTLTLSGKNLKSEVDADLVMSGPGFVVGFEDIQLDPGETLTMNVSADGKQLAFTVSQDGQTPTVFLTTDDGRGKADFKIEVGGVKLNPGKTVAVSLDSAKKRLYFKDNDGKKDSYHVKLYRLNPDGTTNVYESKALKIGKADNYMMDFSKWDGKGAICFEDDEEDNGFDDDKCTEEPNEATPKKTVFFKTVFSEMLNSDRR